MFTGIIEALGRVARKGREGDRTVLGVTCPDLGEGPAPGESIALDGVCLTVTRRIPNGFLADVGSETLRRTTLGEWRPGRIVNLERPLRFGDRLGGHLVQGHVDGTARVTGVAVEPGGKRLSFEMADSFRPYVVERGSIALNGVSLTVTRIPGDRFEVFLVPHTLRETNLGAARAGQRVNVELDLIGKYLERWILPGGGAILKRGSAGE